MIKQTAGRTMDMRIAMDIFGLQVIPDWPCGYMPDGCRLEASLTAEGGDLYPIRHPVYVRKGSTWPPVWNQVIEKHCADVIPVSKYSTDLVPAWAVWDWMIEQQLDHLLSLQYVRGSYAVQVPCGNMMCVVRDSIADTAPLSICLAALTMKSGTHVFTWNE